MDKQDLHGKTAIITGGSSEIAGEVALALAREGVQVCLCGRNADLLEMAANKIKLLGGVCLAIVSDLDSLEAAESVVEQADRKSVV